MIFFSVACDDSVISHFRLTMVDENGFLQDDDAVSRYSDDDQENVGDHDNLVTDLDISGSNSSQSSDEDDDGLGDENPGDGDGVLTLPTQVPDRQDASEVRPQGAPGPAGTPVVSRKRKATDEIMEVFAGPSKKRDPTHVKLRDIGWSMALSVFRPSETWPTKEANAFMAKSLCLVPEQKKELDKDLVQESFLKD